MPMGKVESYRPFSWFCYLVGKITEKGISFTPNYFKEIYIMLRLYIIIYIYIYYSKEIYIMLEVNKEIIGGNSHRLNEGIVLL